MGVEEVELMRIDEPARPVRERIDHDKVEELARSIRDVGLLSALAVRRCGDRFEVVAGHHRLLALRRLGISPVPVVIVAVDGEDVEIVGAHENLVRHDMSPREEGRLVAALMGREGWGIGRTAMALNRSGPSRPIPL